MRVPNLSLLLLGLLSLSSCVQDLVIDFGSQKGVAVDCVLRMQETQTLRLYKLKEIYGSDARAVEDATVTLSAYDEEGEVYLDVAEFRHDGGMEWKASYQPEHGVKYRLTVNVPGEKEIYAETKFPDDLRLIQGSSGYEMPFRHGSDMVLDTLSFEVFHFRVHKANIVMTLKETPAPCDFKYVDGEPVPFRDYREVYQDSCKLWVFPHVDSEYACPNNPDSLWRISHLYPEWYDFHGASKPYAKSVATDHPYVDKFNIASGSVSGLKWCNLPVKPYVTGLEDRKIKYSNLSQWPLIVCPDMPLHDSFLRIAHPAGFVNRKYRHELEYEQKTGANLRKDNFYIIADFSESLGWDWRYGMRYATCVLETHFVSEEYDAYLRDIYSAKKTVDDFILSAYEAKHIYSNVIGGYGIFGADYVTWDEKRPVQY